MLESETNYAIRTYVRPVLTDDDLPVPADYNSDSKTDVAVWFASTGTWHIVDSQTGEIRQEVLGQKGDIPLMSASVFRQ